MAGAGAVGEAIAAWFLANHGVDVVGANIPVGRGEIDLLAWDGSTRVAVEVRLRQTTGDPIDAIPNAKRARVRQLASRIGADRVDLVGVGVTRQGIDVHWVPDGS